MSDTDEKEYDDREEGDDHEPPLPPMLSGDNSDAASVDSNGVKVYKYRDFGDLEDEANGGDESSVLGRVPAPAQTSTRGSGESSIRVQKFPVKLYAILAQKEFQEIIAWMPHGRAWKVLKPSMFESLVMPLFFEYSNYHSFNRLVNAWSFRRVSSGPDRGAYYHELFLRGKPNLHKYMRRLPKMHKKLPMRKGEEPDFYKLDRTNPLPSLEEVPVTNLSTSAQILVNKQQQNPLAQHHMQGGGGGAPQQLGEMSSLTHQQMMDQRIVTPPHPAPMHLPMQPGAPMAPMMQSRGGAPHRYAPAASQAMYGGGQSLEMQGSGAGGGPGAAGYEEYEMVAQGGMQLTSHSGGPRGPMSYHMHRPPLNPSAATSGGGTTTTVTVSAPSAAAAAAAVASMMRQPQGAAVAMRAMPGTAVMMPPPMSPAPGMDPHMGGMMVAHPHPPHHHQYGQPYAHPPPPSYHAQAGGAPHMHPHHHPQHLHHPHATAQYLDQPSEYFLYQQQQQMQHMQQVHQMRMYERQQQALQDEFVGGGGGAGSAGGGAPGDSGGAAAAPASASPPYAAAAAAAAAASGSMAQARY